MRRVLWALALSALGVLSANGQDRAPSAAARTPTMLTGVNVAGAEFGEPDGVHGKDYRYPDDAEIDSVAKSGFGVVRLPFKWEHLQPQLDADLDAAEAKRLDAVVAQARRRKLAIILDPHNYARWRSSVIGSGAVTVASFTDFWRRLAKRYRGQDGVIFGLMNEPHDMRTEDWAQAAQAAIDAIRSAGACNRVLVPGNGWTGAHSWRSDSYGTPNAAAMATIGDPLERTSYEFHQYLDADWSGTAKTCRAPADVVAALAVATSWLEETGHTGFLGEVGAGADPQCLAGLDAMLAHVAAHPRAWRGWTAWSAGAWWPDDYPLLLRDSGGKKTPQLALFERWRSTGDAAFASATCPR